MAKRYSNLTSGLHVWASRHTDLTDGGYRSRRDGVRSYNTNEELEQGLARQGWPSRVTKKHLESHLARNDVIYYRCRRGSDLHPVMIDVDAHKGERNALEVSDLMLALFPGAYREPSTNLRGFHIYPLIVAGRTPRPLFNALMGILAKALAAIAAENNLDAPVEIKGLCTLLTPDKRSVWRRGTLAKYPRPRHQADLDRLNAAPVFDLAYVRRIIAQAPPALRLDALWANTVRSHYGSRPVPDHLILDQDVAGSGFATYPGQGCAPSTSHSSIKLNSSVGESGDAYFRMVQACAMLARVLGRVPAEDELLTYYVEQSLARGSDLDGRAKRARDAIRHCEKTFDPALTSGSGFAENLPSLLAVIRQHVKPEHRLDTCYRWKITEEDLAVVLYLVERGTFRGRAQCGNAYVQAVFARLKGEGVIKRSCDRNKAVAIKTILERAGLSACSNAYYAFGDTSRSKEYIIGVNHPRYPEYVSMLRDLAASAALAEADRPDPNCWDGEVEPLDEWEWEEICS